MRDETERRKVRQVTKRRSENLRREKRVPQKQNSDIEDKRDTQTRKRKREKEHASSNFERESKKEGEGEEKNQTTPKTSKKTTNPETFFFTLLRKKIIKKNNRGRTREAETRAGRTDETRKISFRSLLACSEFFRELRRVERLWRVKLDE